jgi:hypothetical protein
MLRKSSSRRDANVVIGPVGHTSPHITESLAALRVERRAEPTPVADSELKVLSNESAEVRFKLARNVLESTRGLVGCRSEA